MEFFILAVAGLLCILIMLDSLDEEKHEKEVRKIFGRFVYSVLFLCLIFAVVMGFYMGWGGMFLAIKQEITNQIMDTWNNEGARAMLFFWGSLAFVLLFWWGLYRIANILSQLEERRRADK